MAGQHPQRLALPENIVAACAAHHLARALSVGAVGVAGGGSIYRVDLVVGVELVAVAVINHVSAGVVGVTNQAVIIVGLHLEVFPRRLARDLVLLRQVATL